MTIYTFEHQMTLKWSLLTLRSKATSSSDRPHQMLKKWSNICISSSNSINILSISDILHFLRPKWPLMTIKWPWDEINCHRLIRFAKWSDNNLSSYNSIYCPFLLFSSLKWPWTDLYWPSNDFEVQRNVAAWYTSPNASKIVKH